MAENCAPFLANVFLHVYEYEYIEKLVNQMGDIETAQAIAKTFRYQDDCIALNDNGVFVQHFHLIYTPEMVLRLKTTKISKTVCTLCASDSYFLGFENFHLLWTIQIYFL